MTSDELIAGLNRRDNKTLRYIYKNYYRAVRQLVVLNNGTEQDAQDIFQETLIALFRNIRGNADFKLNCSFSTYLYSVARLLWLKHLRNTRDEEKKLSEAGEYIEFEEPEPFTVTELRYSLYQKAFLKLPDDCQKILKLTLDGLEQKNIAEEMGLKSENYIRKRKHFCKEYLIKLIKSDPDYLEGE